MPRIIYMVDTCALKNECSIARNTSRKNNKESLSRNKDHKIDSFMDLFLDKCVIKKVIIT